MTLLYHRVRRAYAKESFKSSKKRLIQTKRKTKTKPTRSATSQLEAEDILVRHTVHLLESQTRGSYVATRLLGHIQPKVLRPSSLLITN